MPIQKPLLLGDPQLREESEDVKENENIIQITRDLKDTLTNVQKTEGMGRGIAAPQLGYPKKIVFIQTPDFRETLINPQITWKSDEMFDVWDSCFSLDSAFFVKIPRHRKIKVRWRNPDWEEKEEEFIDGFSELLQHEIDHLHGVMCTDHLSDPKDIVMRSEWAKRYRKPGIGM